MRSHFTWFLILAAVCLAGPYLFHVQPRTRRHWTYLAIALAFLAWMLALMTPLHSR